MGKRSPALDRPKVKTECLRLLATLRLDPARSRDLIQRNLPLETIAKVTGVSIAQLQQLQSQAEPDRNCAQSADESQMPHLPGSPN